MARPNSPSENAGLALGLKLREIRKRAGLTQAEVASQFGVEQSALSHLEKRDDILVSTLRQYLHAVGAELRIDTVVPDGLGRRLEDRQTVFPIFADAPQDRRDVVFSIKPEHSQKIVAGTKTVELRRRFPLVPAGTLALIYTTSPTRALNAIAEIEIVHRAKPSQIWKEFGEEACVGKRYFDSYFSGVDIGFAIKLKRARPLSKSWDLRELRTKCKFEAPQSFFYATPQLRDALKNECPELFN